MKVLYLHIGTPKTATSSIQLFLSENRKTLEQHGYCFPKQPHKYPYVSQNRNAHFMLGDKNSANQPTKEEIERDLLEGIEMVRECFKQYDNVILTDEDLWARLKLFQEGRISISGAGSAAGRIPG